MFVHLTKLSIAGQHADNILFHSIIFLEKDKKILNEISFFFFFFFCNPITLTYSLVRVYTICYSVTNQTENILTGL